MIVGEYPAWVLSLFLFGAIFNLTVSIMMFYLRSKGGSEKYTKSQLWALTLLAWLFLFNFLIAICDVTDLYLYNTDNLLKSWDTMALWMVMTIFTSYLLLAFGLVYPRPFTKWTRLRHLLLAIIVIGLGTVAFDIRVGHLHVIPGHPNMDILSISYLFGVFVPVFIWSSEYGRQPSNEGRMMYTILIWGFLFAIITRTVRQTMIAEWGGSYLPMDYKIQVILIIMVMIKLALSMWKVRKRWATPETIHIGMIIFSLVVSIISGVIYPNIGGAGQYEPDLPIRAVSNFMGLTFGWLIVRPALFSYGLLRYRLLGSQVRAEKDLAMIGAVLMSSAFCLIIINLTQGQSSPSVIFGAILLAVLLLYPFLKVAQGMVLRLLPMSAGAEGASMRERRNTYLMGLQTAVVKGEISDKQDSEALEELRKALRVTEREHILLLESIAKHEARSEQRREVEEAYLIYWDGRLLAHLIPDPNVLKVGMKEGAAVKEKDKDIVAGMFAAISEYVKDVMRREDTGGRMDTISYGTFSLVIESYRYVSLAIILKSQDDLVVRQAMRDTLAEIHEIFGKHLDKEWDGNRENLEGVDEVLSRFVKKVRTLEG